MADGAAGDTCRIDFNAGAVRFSTDGANFASALAALSTPHAIGIDANGVNTTMRVDGTLFPAPGNCGAAGPADFTFLNDSGFTNGSACGICEFAISASGNPWSAAEWAEIENYQKGFYGIGLF